MIEVLRVMLLIVRWLLLIGSGLCAMTVAATPYKQIALIALAVGLACGMGIYALSRKKRENC